MLAERFTTAEAGMQQQAQEDADRRAARDEFIRVQYPLMNQRFATMVNAATGSHPRLQIARGVVTEVFSGRGFASLDNTQTEIRSTLYGPPEIVRFVSALESVVDGQFGVLRLTLENLKPRFKTDAEGLLFQSLLTSGGPDDRHAVGRPHHPPRQQPHPVDDSAARGISRGAAGADVNGRTREPIVEIERLVIEVPDGDATPREELEAMARQAIEDYVARLMREEE
jgi:hypothetical protein